MMTYKNRLFLRLTLAIGAWGCSSPQKKGTGEQSRVEARPVILNQEAQLLLKNLEEAGDYVNSRNFPSLIKASVVYQELNGNNHIIDLRTPAEFSKGHIRGAVNVPFEKLPEYLETSIKPFEFGKIILTCDAGQVSSYAASLLRLMGYSNVYAMRWGMSAWNPAFAKAYWLKEISSGFEEQLDTITVQPAQPADFPVLNTGKTTGEEIREVRFRKLMSEGSQVALITAKEVFANPGNFYIINFERKDKYEAGHIPGAIRYKPAGTLGIAEEMENIPADKTVVLYCGTGHNSGFATAYLRMFGYDAKTLIYGNNGFMHNKMVEEKGDLSWLPFTEAEVSNFEVVR